jgi:hypothetical protein
MVGALAVHLLVTPPVVSSAVVSPEEEPVSSVASLPEVSEPEEEGVPVEESSSATMVVPAELPLVEPVSEPESVSEPTLAFEVVGVSEVAVVSPVGEDVDEVAGALVAGSAASLLLPPPSSLQPASSAPHREPSQG